MAGKNTTQGTSMSIPLVSESQKLYQTNNYFTAIDMSRPINVNG